MHGWHSVYMETKQQNKIAAQHAERAFEVLFGEVDFSFGQLDERFTKDGSLITSWEANYGKKYARCFLTVTSNGNVPFAPRARWMAE